MPISPRECQEIRIKQTKPAFEYHCGRIDEMLAESSKYEYWFDIRGIDSGVLGDIERAYESVGWDVRRVADQRDGDALVFKERK